MLDQHPAPVHEKDLIDGETSFAEDGGDDDRSHNGDDGEGEDGEDRCQIAPQRGWRLDIVDPFRKLRTDRTVCHVIVEERRVDGDRLPDGGIHDSGEVHAVALARRQVRQGAEPGGRDPDIEEGTNPDRDAHVVRRQVLDVGRVDIGADDVRDVHNEVDLTPGRWRRGEKRGHLQLEHADENPNRHSGDPGRGGSSSELDGLRGRDPGSASGRVRVDDGRHREAVGTTRAEEAALPFRERRVGGARPARRREDDRRADQREVGIEGEVHADELEGTASRHVHPDAVRDRLVPFGGPTIRGEGERVGRGGRSRRPAALRERGRRHELNDKTREWVEKRDALNAQVRALVDEATQHRIQRDELNAQVKAAKEERDRYNRRVNELQDQLTELKRRKLPRGAVPLGKLQQELKRLEFRQMTSVLTVDKERALIDEIQHLQAEVKKLEKSLEENEDVRKMKDELKSARDLAEDAHKRVSELAEKAQAEHDQMTPLYEQAANFRPKADRAKEEFTNTKR